MLYTLLYKAIPKWVWLSALVLILGVSLYKNIQMTLEYKERAEVFENTISDLNQTIKETKIKMNDSITLYQAEVKNLNYSVDNIKAKYDKLLSASKLKAKDVNTITEVSAQIVGHDTVEAVVDTFGGINAKIDDEFVSIDVKVTPEKMVMIDYEIIDSIVVINVQKKHSILFGLIKWKSLESTRVINRNPKARIVNLQTVNVVE